MRIHRIPHSYSSGFSHGVANTPDALLKWISKSIETHLLRLNFKDATQQKKLIKPLKVLFLIMLYPSTPLSAELKLVQCSFIKGYFAIRYRL
jgi:hypothetical protein